MEVLIEPSDLRKASCITNLLSFGMAGSIHVILVVCFWEALEAVYLKKVVIDVRTYERKSIRVFPFPIHFFADSSHEALEIKKEHVEKVQK